MRCVVVMLCCAGLTGGDPEGAAPRITGREVVEEVNLARRNPKAYAEHLRGFLGRFRGRRLERPGGIDLITQEGEPAVREAIAFLERQAPLAPLGYSEPLAKAAADHVAAQGPTGQTGHTGPRGDRMSDRIEARGSWSHTIGECISYGSREARDIVVQLIIDDGVANRGHRKALFQAEYRVAGAAVGPHAAYGTMAVLDFAGGMKP